MLPDIRTKNVFPSLYKHLSEFSFPFFSNSYFFLFSSCKKYLFVPTLNRGIPTEWLNEQAPSR